MIPAATIPTHCSHGVKLNDPNEPCIDCEIDRNRSKLEHHLTCVSLCARRLAELGRRRSEKSEGEQ